MAVGLLLLLLGSVEPTTDTPLGLLWFPQVPHNFCQEEKPGCQSRIDLFVNRLDSYESALPYEYNAFDFCQDENETRPVENFGQVLLGDRITSSPYKFMFKRNEVCQVACMKSYDPKKPEDRIKLDFMKKGMMLNYQYHWIIDNMPVTWCYDVEDIGKYCNPGFPMGCFIAPDGRIKDACVINTGFNRKNTFYPFNHIDITIQYHSGKDEGWPGARLVAARMEPKSYKHTDVRRPDCYGPPMEIPAEFSSNVDVIYTYSVRFEENDYVKWASRWDYILESMPHLNVLWFSLMTSLVIVVFLSGMVAIIFLRTLRKDIARYNQTDPLEDTQKRRGWILVHEDMFWPPRNGMLLSAFLGQGTQIVITIFVTLFVACLGFLSPAKRGAFMTCVAVLWVLLGAPAGFVSARMYKTFGGEMWKTNVLLMALLLPGVVFANFLIMNVIYWCNGSSATIPSGTLVTILVLWFGVSVPLTFVGSYFGFKKPIEHPVPTNQIPPPIPEQPIYKRPLLGIILGSILPFGCIFFQLFFILNNFWVNQIYNAFGFLFLDFIIFLITCSEVAILLCYFYMRAEDYHWWWRSFLTSSFTAVYVFIYAVYYFFSKLQISGTTSTMIYFGYTMIMVLIFFLFTGTTGFLATYWFVCRVYRIVKVDPAPKLAHQQQEAYDLNIADVSVSKQNLEVQVKP